LQNLSAVREIIGRWVEHYDNARLRAGPGYPTPADIFRGDPAKRSEERERKLETARQARRLKTGSGGQLQRISTGKV
jgi:hypothetical protein